MKCGSGAIEKGCSLKWKYLLYKALIFQGDMENSGLLSSGGYLICQQSAEFSHDRFQLAS
jgi:hypothetical protein